MTPKSLANFLLNDFTGILHKTGKTIENCGVAPEELAFLLACEEYNFITRAMVKQRLEQMINDNLKVSS